MSEQPLQLSGGYVIQQESISALQGRLLTLIEAIGLPEGQEKAVKDLVKNELWKLCDYVVWCPSDLHIKIWKDQDKSKPPKN